VLHKLNVAASDVNKALAERNFMAATHAVYNFWLYELCDVYIEAMKPMTDEGVSADTKLSAQNTLYTCLDGGLKLLHPFMPFVTEELWQRLPRRPNDTTPSIMLADYPVEDSQLDYPNSERDFDLVFSVIRTTRSIAAQYNLQSNLQVHVLASNALESLLQSQAPTIQALTKGCKSVNVLTNSAEIPLGCGSAVVSADCSIHLLVKGLVNIDDELAKISKKLDAVKISVDKLQRTMQQSNYEEVIPENVRASNDEKMRTLDTELATLEQSQEMFAKLK